jgi:hypothetical protein
MPERMPSLVIFYNRIDRETEEGKRMAEGLIRLSRIMLVVVGTEGGNEKEGRRDTADQRREEDLRDFQKRPARRGHTDHREGGPVPPRGGGDNP